MIATRILDRLVARLAVGMAPPAARLTPWIVDGRPVGYLDAQRAGMLARWPDVFVVGTDAVRFASTLHTFQPRTEALAAVAAALHHEGELSAWRNEWYAVPCHPGEAPLFLLERAAARFFGIHTRAVHLNASSVVDGAACMWLARRSTTKAIDPGKLDNLVGGGVAAGLSLTDTLVKEAWEEAGLPETLARSATPSGTVEVRCMQPDGLQRETIHVHDLAIAPAFVPVNQDGEVVEFRRVPVEVAAVLAGNASGDDIVTADASLVIADWLLRHGHVAPGSPAFAALAALCRAEAPAPDR